AAGRQAALGGDHHPGGPRGDRLGREIEPDDPLSREREEELLGLDGAAVGGGAAERRSRAGLQDRPRDRPNGEVEGTSRGAHALPPAARAAAASSRSSKCSRVVPTIW